MFATWVCVRVHLCKNHKHVFAHLLLKLHAPKLEFLRIFISRRTTQQWQSKCPMSLSLPSPASSSLLLLLLPPTSSLLLFCSCYFCCPRRAHLISHTFHIFPFFMYIFFFFASLRFLLFLLAQTLLLLLLWLLFQLRFFSFLTCDVSS